MHNNAEGHAEEASSSAPGNLFSQHDCLFSDDRGHAHDTQVEQAYVRATEDNGGRITIEGVENAQLTVRPVIHQQQQRQMSAFPYAQSRHAATRCQSPPRASRTEATPLSAEQMVKTARPVAAQSMGASSSSQTRPSRPKQHHVIRPPPRDKLMAVRRKTYRAITRQDV